ncbi:MAG: hypothetical protein CXR30_19355 [Geobacter sp.]|nr:MAG: hypothetical protein CXR30_19355 [Geobacter sp.]
MKKETAQKIFTQSPVNKYLIVYILITISILCYFIEKWWPEAHYPELSELKHTTGELVDYSITESPKHNEIDLKLKNENVYFVFNKIDYFPLAKAELSKGSIVEIWSDKPEYDKGEHSEVWQLYINGKLIMSRDTITSQIKERVKDTRYFKFVFFYIGILFLVAFKFQDIISSKSSEVA